MILGKLLEEIKIGTEEYKAQELVEELNNTFSEDYEKYITYKLMNNSLANLYENKNEINEEVLKKLIRLSNKVKDIEKKETLTDSYSKMKLEGMIKEFNNIVESINNKKVLRSLDKDELAKVLALASYNIINLQEISNTEDVKLELLPESFKPFYDKQINIIIETIM